MARFLTARWERLVMLNYEIDPALLHDRVPRGTQLDAWNGKNFVSVVGFHFLDTRVLGVSVPWHRDFEEINLRFYVRREIAGEVRRGVVFIKEIVPRAAVAWLANAFYNERYVALPMSHGVTQDALARRVSYSAQQAPHTFSLSAVVSGEPAIPRNEDEATFIAEHYWGYVSQRDGSTVEYQVEHPRWRVWRAEHASLEGDMCRLYGDAFGRCLTQEPSSAFVAEGSPVTVHRGVSI